MVLSNSCRCGAGFKTMRTCSKTSRVRNPAPIFSFFFFFFLLFLFFFVHGRWFQCVPFFYFFFFFATHHPPVISTTVLRGVPTLRAHSAQSHRPGVHGLLEVPLHLLPSPAKLFQRRICQNSPGRCASQQPRSFASLCLHPLRPAEPQQHVVCPLHACEVVSVRFSLRL